MHLICTGSMLELDRMYVCLCVWCAKVAGLCSCELFPNAKVHLRHNIVLG